MKKTLLAMMSGMILACGLATACNQSEPPKPPTPTPAKPIEMATRGAEKVAADNAFAFRLFEQTLATAPEADRKNAFISPLSVTMALGMLYNGASPDAAAEMAEALGVSDFTPGQINAHYRTLMEALLAADELTTLAIANSIWSEENFAVKPSFYEVNSEWYDAPAQSRDFRLPATLDEINAWCADKTEGKIPTILDNIPADAVMYLINAVYFKGTWKYEFDPAETRDEPFTRADGSTPSVKMMGQQGDLPYYRDETVQAVDLPYGNGAFSMTVIMPDDSRTTLDEMMAGMDATAFDAIVGGMHTQEVQLKLPRWKQECKFKLNDAVHVLGMERIFQTGGNLGGINEDPRLKVSEIAHKTFVEVGEQGTEAAAVTSIGVIVTSIGPSQPVSFVADRPFVYLIRERSTGAILFMGRIDSPA